MAPRPRRRLRRERSVRALPRPWFAALPRSRRCLRFLRVPCSRVDAILVCYITTSATVSAFSESVLSARLCDPGLLRRRVHVKTGLSRGLRRGRVA